MASLHFPRVPLPPPVLSSPYSTNPLCSFKPVITSSARPKPISVKVPARDRIIDFGKHSGRMLGTLPSKYLTWVSKNLRARDFEEWAKLADEVLLDPVYRNRMEWESAERILSGEGLKAFRSESPVSGLLEISERFGWDNEDKVGWSKVDFELLGTSRGGRIPRRKLDGEALTNERGVGFLSRDSRVSNIKQMGSLEKSSKRDSRVSKTSNADFSFKRDSELDGDMGNSWFMERKVGFLSKGSRFIVGEDYRVEETGRRRREERRERQMLRRGRQLQMLRREFGAEEEREQIGMEEESGQIGRKSSGYSNPFPGREALLDKIRGRRNR